MDLLESRMSLRIIWNVLLHFGGLGLAWYLYGQGQLIPAFWLLAAILLLDMLWLLLDTWQAQRLLGWMRRELPSPEPDLHGIWQELVVAAYRSMRKQRRRVEDSERQMLVFLDALSATPNGVILVDELGRIEWLNPAAGEFFGLASPQDYGQHLGNLVRDPAFARYWAAPEGQPGGVTMNGRQHSLERPVRLSVQAFPFGQGRRILLVRDVTSVEQAERMRRDFVANVSHEVRTPLTVLSGFVETMQSVPLSPEESQRYLELMAQQARRMQHLVQDLLTLSRLEGSPPPDHSERAHLAEILEIGANDARALSEVLAAEKGEMPHRIVCRIEPDVPEEVFGSVSELQSAIGNLLSNAVRYTPEGSEIVAGLQRNAEGGVALYVKDHGPGIPAEHLPRITERFYRVDRSRSRETGGTGLGLAIVKHVAQRHGARLHVESKPGDGALFALDFPEHRLFRHEAATPPRPELKPRVI